MHTWNETYWVFGEPKLGYQNMTDVITSPRIKISLYYVV